ncbi:MAG: sulfite exporter TauE/SafE family protein [Burkholderiales bacterium]|nr:sulfite exporter TauE/SafE family protein [Burkholderiales bacterium]
MPFNLIDNPWFYAAAVPAIILTGISKGGFGSGIGGVAVPLMALVISPVQAAAIMLPILMVMDAVGLLAYRGRWDRAVMRVILPAGLAGIAIGWLTFRYLNEYAIRLVLGAIAIGFVANVAARRGLPKEKPPAAKGRFWSMVSGFTSFVAHAGGPPLNVWLIPQRLDKAVFVGTTVVFFAAINAAKVVPYLALGLFDARNLGTSVALFPVAVAGIYLGIFLQRRLSAAGFMKTVYALLFAAGAKLLYDGIAGLAA